MHKHCCKLTSFTPVTHVIFDLDGTIIDSEKVYMTAIKQAVENYDVKYQDDFILKVQGKTQQDMAKHTVEYFNLPCTDDEYLDLFNEIANKELGDLDLMPGAERIINHLQKNGVPICIATSSNQTSFDLKMNKFPQLIERFHHIVCGGSDPEVTNGKPAPDIFLVAASRFEEPTPKPTDCLVFEDSVNGLKAGLAAGMQVVMLPDNQVSYNEWKNATLRLDSFNYMLPEFFNLPAFPDDEMAEEFASTKVLKIDVTAIEETLKKEMSFGPTLAENSKKDIEASQTVLEPPLMQGSTTVERETSVIEQPLAESTKIGGQENDISFEEPLATSSKHDLTKIEPTETDIGKSDVNIDKKVTAVDETDDEQFKTANDEVEDLTAQDEDNFKTAIEDA